MKFHNISTILIWSENYKALADWYQTTFDLKITEALTYPDDTGILFEFPSGGPWLWIGQHSQVKGKNTDPCRIMFNISVNSVSEAYEYLLQKDVKFLATPFLSPSGESYFATMYDIDGNLVQIIGKK